jgi:hypothetical protein
VQVSFGRWPSRPHRQRISGRRQHPERCDEEVPYACSCRTGRPPQPCRIAHSRDAPLEAGDEPDGRAGAAGDPSRHHVRFAIGLRTDPRSLQQAAPSQETASQSPCGAAQALFRHDRSAQWSTREASAHASAREPRMAAVPCESTVDSERRLPQEEPSCCPRVALVCVRNRTTVPAWVASWWYGS